VAATQLQVTSRELCLEGIPKHKARRSTDVFYSKISMGSDKRLQHW